MKLLRNIFLVLIVVCWGERHLLSQEKVEYVSFSNFLCDTLQQVDGEFLKNESRIFIADKNHLFEQLKSIEETSCTLVYCEEMLDMFMSDGYSYFTILNFETNPDNFTIRLRYNKSNARPEEDNVFYDLEWKRQ